MNDHKHCADCGGPKPHNDRDTALCDACEWPCVSDLFPPAALAAMVHESGAPKYDDGHTDCYYAGLLLAALPHLTPAVIAGAVAFDEKGER